MVEQLVAPLDGRAQRLLPVRRVAGAAGEQVEALREPLDDLLWCQRFHPRRGQLEREREPVEAARDLRHVLVRLEARFELTRALREQLNRVLEREHGHRILVLGA